MQIHRSAVEIVVQTPAKLNLFFEVLARRADGYHEVETLMCPIDLFDTLYFKEEPSGKLVLECQWATMMGGPQGAGFDSVPRGPDNLVMRAVELLRRGAGVCRGASLRLVKRIPAAAGLGGGSSDAAAALVAANLAWSLGLSQTELAQAAAQLGSDVPFFLGGGAAICRGRGQRMEPVGELGPLDFVVVRPPAGLATAAVYGVCRPAQRPRSVDAPGAGAPRGRCPKRGPAAVEPFAAGRRTAVAVDQAASGNLRGPGLVGTWNEWQWNIVLWALSSRSPCTTAGATLTSNRDRERLRRADLPLKRRYEDVSEVVRRRLWKSPRFASSSWRNRGNGSRLSARSPSTTPS